MAWIDRYQALFHVWHIIHMGASKNQGQPVPSLDQETTNLIPPIEDRDLSEVKAAINPSLPTDERQAKFLTLRRQNREGGPGINS